MSSFVKRKEYYERLGLEEGATTGRLRPLSFCTWVAFCCFCPSAFIGPVEGMGNMRPVRLRLVRPGSRVICV